MVRKKPGDEPLPAAVKQAEVVAQPPALPVHPFNQPSRVPLANQLNLLRTRSYRRVIEEENELIKALHDHALEEDRLLDVDTEILIEREAKQKTLCDLQHDKAASEVIATLEREVKRKELELKIARLDKELGQAKGDGGRKKEPGVADKILALDKELQGELEKLRAKGYSENDREWQVTMNHYESLKERLFDR